MTEQECGKLMLEYAQFWPIKADDMRLKIRAYWHGLQDIEYLTAQQALLKLARTSKFAPTVAELRETAEPIIRAALPVGRGGDWLKRKRIPRLKRG